MYSASSVLKDDIVLLRDLKKETWILKDEDIRSQNNLVKKKF